MITHSVGSFYRSVFILATGSLVLATAVLSASWFSAGAASFVTWDGGGTTNNWSEAANWSSDAVPTSSDDVIFDSTSTKDVTIDTSITVSSIRINTGYTGTIIQSDTASITISGCNGRTCFFQGSGTFNGSSNTITLTGAGFGAILTTGGTFNGGSGDISVTPVTNQFNDVSLQGGTFKSTSGTFTAPNSFNIQGASFVNNSGTIKLVGDQSSGITSGATDIFNNVTVNKANAGVSISGRLVVAGTLALSDGSIGNNGNTVEARGGLSISPNFDGGNATLEIANGTGTRNFTFSADLNLPKVVINDPNVTVGTTGTGTLHFSHQLILQQGTFNQGTVDLVIEPLNVGGGACFVQSGGTFNASANTITLNGNGFGVITLTGGVFEGGSGDIIGNSAPGQIDNISLQGGTFTSTSGTLTVPDSLNIQGGTFVNNSGTVDIVGVESTGVISGASDIFNNVVINKPDANLLIGGRFVVAGSLALDDGSLSQNGTVIESRGDLSISPNFDGGNVTLELANGSGTRHFTFSTDLKLPKVVINDPNVTIDTSGSGTLHFAHQLILEQGTFNQGNVDLLIEPLDVGGGVCYVQSGGIFNGSANTIAFNGNGFGSMNLTGGTFNGGSGDLTSNDAFTMTGGTFRSTSGTLFAARNWNIAGGTFIHNGGTVTFNGTESNDSIGTPAGGTLFNDINLNRPANIFLGNVAAEGTLTLNAGSLTNGSLEARGNLTIGPGFAGGNPTVAFTGSSASGLVNQTFTNNGGANPTGAWTVNKTSGTVTAATDFILGTSQTLSVTSGSLFLADGSDLTAGVLTIATAGKLINDSSTTITLGGNVSNAGVIDLQGGGAACPENDSILVRSSAPGTRRNWSGTGVFRLVDVDVADQAGTAAITVFSGTDSGNNDANFTFNNGCPTDLAISPQSTSAITGVNVPFTASGGFGTRTFSIPVNNSGATISSSNGVYKAGTTPDVSDTVRVTDGLGNTADATVNVTGPASKLAFTVEPSDAAAGQSISPSITVTVEDAGGATIGNATNIVTLSFLNNAGGGTLSGTLSHNAVGGVATFDNVSINRSGTGYTLKATASGLTQAQSTAFNISAAAAAQIAFTVQPTNASVNSAISPPIQVSIKDSLGNLVSDATNSVTLAIGANPGASTLSGTLTQTAVGGVATFADISLDVPGTGYTLTASATSLTGATSDTFDVTSPFIVTSTNDSGLGSLRDVINNANATPGTQTIAFNIPGSGPFVITPSTALPNIKDSVIIDGSTQPGFAGSPLIEINGSGFTASLGLTLQTNDSTIKGLAIGSCSQRAITIAGSGNSIVGDRIGISASGAQLGNGEDLRIVSGTNNIIGGPDPKDQNIISGSTGNGILISSSTNTIQGNLIGTDVSGTSAFANNVGIRIEANGNNIIDNVVSGNSTTGIAVKFGVTGNVIQNNIIGLDITGTLPLGNGGSGIRIEGGTGNRISQNSIFANGLLGITLGNRGLTNSGPPLPNDPQDGDGGANNQQNYPFISSLNTQPSDLKITGQLNSTPSSNFTLEFFASPSCDASGNGEGAMFIGSGNVSTPASGIVAFSIDLPVTVDGSQFITATATDANGNTSEFSPCRGSQFSIQGTVFHGPGTVPIFGAIVKLHNAATGVDKFLTTDSLGRFSQPDIPAGHTVAASATKPNFVVTGTTTTTDQFGNQVVNIQMLQIAATISGRVTLNGASLGGVTMTLSGGGSATTTTDSSGNYTFSNLPTGGTSYTITPSRQGFAFTPPSFTTNLTTDQTANFTATNLLANLPGRIVYESNGNITTGNANGTGFATIFTSSLNFSFGSGATHNLLPAGSSSELMFGEPNFSNDGGKIAFISDFESASNSGSTSTVSLQTSNPDGSSATSVIGNGAGSLSRVSFSPDGTKLASGKLVGGVRQLVTVKVSDGTITPLVTTGTANIDPDWSPDGTKLVFVRDDATTAGISAAIFIVDATGANLTKRTTSSFSDTAPRWSPDGTKIAFLRSTASGAGSTQVVTMNPDGSGQSVVHTAAGGQIFDLRWAPDSSRLAFIEGTNSSASLESILPDGSSKLTILSHLLGSGTFDWGPTPFVFPPIGNNINVNIGNINLGFTGITGLASKSAATGSQATIDAELIPPASVGTPPPGFVLGDIAYQINTTATFTPPVMVCIDVPADQYPTAASFDEAALLHDAGGTLVDVTISRDLGLHRICGQTNTLGNFVIANHVNSALPSISGVVVDTDGNPLDDFTVSLSGDGSGTATTGADGSFTFVNLTDGGNYLVTPTRIGYRYSAPFQGYANITGEQTVVFVATPASFKISGTVTDGNLIPQDHVTVTLGGTASGEVVTNDDGTYSFDDLPANGTYFVTPSLIGASFTPDPLTIDALEDNVTGADFIGLLPTAAPVSVSGRVVRANGQGISAARLTLVSSTGEVRSALTNPFGYYHFDNVDSGATYVLSISSKNYRFANTARVINLVDEMSDVDFTALP